MTTGALLVARLSSSRLPAKNLMEMAGKPMIRHLAERIGAARHIDKVVIATSLESSDDPLEAYGAEAGIAVHRGPLDDVMARIVGAAQAHNIDTIVEILGDNPLIEPALVDDVIALYRDGGYDYAANISRDYQVRPDGLKLFSIGIRVQVYSAAAAARYTEFPDIVNAPGRHPSAFLFDQPDVFKCGYLEATGPWAHLNRPPLNFAVNYKKNFDLVRSIFEKHYPGDPLFPLSAVMEQLDEERHLYALFGAE